MKPEELRALVRREVNSATNYLDEELTEFRVKALDYYHGEPFGNEVEGASQVVLTEVADTIDFIMPAMMRIFTATDDYAQFAPRGPEDVQSARQATDYCSYVVTSQNRGFLLLHNWFKDAMLAKIGVVKSYWDSRLDTTEETYEELDDASFEALTADPDIEIVAHEEKIEEGDGLTPPRKAHYVTVRKTEEAGQIVVENVPGEEFLLEKQAKGPIDKLRFCAHRTTMTVSDLVAMGYDRETVEENAGYTALQYDEEKQTRFKDLDALTLNDKGDTATQDVLVTECFIRADYDGDGIAELRRVLCIGEELEVLENEPWDKIPFAVLSPILMPHRLIGRSIAELTMDIQLIKSTLLRQMLDNLYKNNNAAMEAVEGKVNLDDLLNPAPGGVVRVREINSVRSLAPPVMMGEAFPMLSYLDDTRDQRTGINKAAAGLDADALQSTTKVAVDATIKAAQAKIELIARVFAETGVRDLYFNILHLAQKHVEAPQMVRLRGEFVPMDPRTWANQYDFTVNVGLGTGQTEEKVGYLMQISQMQAAIIMQAGPDNPIVKPWQYAATLGKLVEAVGFKDTQTYFMPPQAVMQELQSKAAQGPQPDPKMQAEMAKVQGELMLKREEMAQKLQLQREEMAQKMQLRREELDMEARLRAAEIAMKGNPSTNLPRAQ